MMNQSFPEAIAWAAASAPIGTIIDIGAGSGDILHIPAAASAQRIVLVEPNPLLLAGLTMLANDDARITVMPVAVADASGPAILRQYNFPALTSLKPPSNALLELFPGLRQTRQHDVETLALAAILAEALPPQDKDAATNDLLIVEANGAEMQIVQDLLASDHAARFAYIFLHGAQDGAYADTPPLTQVQALLADAGYALSARDDADPDFPWLFLALDRHSLRLRDLQTEAETQRKAHKAAQQRIEELTKQLDATKTESRGRSQRVEDLKKEVAALQAGQAAAKADQDAQLALRQGLADTLALRQTALEAEKAASATELAEREQRLALLQTQVEDQAKAQDADHSKIAELTKQLDGLKAESRGRAERIEGLKRDHAALIEKHRISEASLAERDLQLAARQTQIDDQAKAQDADRGKIAELTKQLEGVRTESRGRAERIEGLKRDHAALLEKYRAGDASLTERDLQLAAQQTRIDDQAKAQDTDRSKIAELAKQLDGVKAESRGRAERIEGLKRDQAALLEKHRISEASLAERDLQLAARQTQIDEQVKAQEADRLKIRDLSKQVDDAKVQLEDQAKARNADRLKIEERNQHLDNVKAESRARAERVEQLKRDNAALLEKQATMEAELAERDRHNALLQAGLEQQGEAQDIDRLKIEGLYRQLSDAQAENSDHAEQHEALAHAHAALLEKLAMAEAALAERDRQLDGAQAESRSRAERVEDLKRENAALQGKRLTGETHLAERTQHNALLQGQLDEQAKARAADRSKIEDLGKQLDAAKGESRSRSVRVEDLKKEGTALREEITQLRSENMVVKDREQNVRDSLLRAEAQLSLMKDLIGLQTQAHAPRIQKRVVAGKPPAKTVAMSKP